MKLSLSGRIAELEGTKAPPAVTFEALAELAADIGFHALGIRTWQVPMDAPDDHVRGVRQVLDRHGLQASMITLRGCFDTERSDTDKALERFDRDIEVADILGAGLIRVTINNDNDVRWAKRAADRARERGIRLVQETHTNSPFETVDECLEMVERIGRPNFGILLDPVNLVLCSQDYGPESIKALGPHLFNVYVQNLRVDENGSLPCQTKAGLVHYERLVLGEPGGIDLDRLFAGLRAIDYDGFITSHQPLIPDTTVRDLAQRVYDSLEGQW